MKLYHGSFWLMNNCMSHDNRGRSRTVQYSFLIPIHLQATDLLGDYYERSPPLYAVGSGTWNNYHSCPSSDSELLENLLLNNGRRFKEKRLKLSQYHDWKIASSTKIYLGTCENFTFFYLSQMLLLLDIFLGLCQIR